MLRATMRRRLSAAEWIATPSVVRVAAGLDEPLTGLVRCLSNMRSLICDNNERR